MRRAIYSVVMVMALLAGAARLTIAQDEPAKETSGDATQKAVDKEKEEARSHSLFGDLLPGHWSLRSSLQFLQTYDDNVFLANSFRKADTVSKYSGRFTIGYLGKHSRFEANYIPEYDMYQRYSQLNFFSHSYYQSYVHEFSVRTEVHWNASFQQMPSRGNLPFTVVNFGGFSLPRYNLEALKDGLNITNASTNLGGSYRWSRKLTLKVELDSSNTLFTDRGNPLFSTVSTELVYSVGGRLGAEYQLTPARSIGVELNNTYFGFVGPSAHQYYQSARVTLNQRLRNGYRFSVAAGPSFTTRQGGANTEISSSFEGRFGRQTANSGFSVSVGRSSQVGLLQQSVSAYYGSLMANRNFGRHWVGSVSGNYSRSESATGTIAIESIAGTAQVGYRINNNLTTYVNYGYTHENNLTNLPGSRNIDRNEVAIGLVYNFPSFSIH